MKIDRIECSLLRFPLPAPLKPAWAPGRTFTFTTCTLIRITSDEGLVGFGAAPDTGAAALNTVAELVAPYLLGKPVHAIEQISPILRNAARDGSYPWAIETALWDLIGKECGKPVSHLWGSDRGELPVYASLAEVRAPRDEIDQIHALRAMGFGAFKLRLHRRDVGEDIELVRQVRKEFGSDVVLMADCNQAHVMPSPGPHYVWSFDTALRVARALQELGVAWLEEPLPRYDYRQLAELRRRAEIPLAGGELNQGLHEYRALIDEDCYDIIQADAAFSEGIFQLRKVAAYAELHYKPFIPHTWSNGVGLVANLQLAASVPNCSWFEYPIDLPAWTPEARDFMLSHPVRIEANGTIRVPKDPGFGIEIDEERVRAHAVQSWDSAARREGRGAGAQ